LVEELRLMGTRAEGHGQRERRRNGGTRVWKKGKLDNMGEKSKYTAGTQGEGAGFRAKASGFGCIIPDRDSYVRRSGRGTRAAAEKAAIDAHGAR
jgi:hypothetical protein